VAQRYVNNKFGIYKLANDDIFDKWRHLVIVTSNYHNLNPPMVRFIQVTSIVHFQIEDFEFIMELNEQLSNFEFVKRPVESILSVCSML